MTWRIKVIMANCLTNTIIPGTATGNRLLCLGPGPGLCFGVSHWCRAVGSDGTPYYYNQITYAVLSERPTKLPSGWLEAREPKTKCARPPRPSPCVMLPASCVRG